MVGPVKATHSTQLGCGIRLLGARGCSSARRKMYFHFITTDDWRRQRQRQCQVSIDNDVNYSIIEVGENEPSRAEPSRAEPEPGPSRGRGV